MTNERDETIYAFPGTSRTENYFISSESTDQQVVTQKKSTESNRKSSLLNNADYIDIKSDKIVKTIKVKLDNYVNNKNLAGIHNLLKFIREKIVIVKCIKIQITNFLLLHITRLFNKCKKETTLQKKYDIFITFYIPRLNKEFLRTIYHNLTVVTKGKRDNNSLFEDNDLIETLELFQNDLNINDLVLNRNNIKEIVDVELNKIESDIKNFLALRTAHFLRIHLKNLDYEFKQYKYVFDDEPKVKCLVGLNNNQIEYLKFMRFLYYESINFDAKNQKGKPLHKRFFLLLLILEHYDGYEPPKPSPEEMKEYKGKKEVRQRDEEFKISKFAEYRKKQNNENLAYDARHPLYKKYHPDNKDEQIISAGLKSTATNSETKEAKNGPTSVKKIKKISFCIIPQSSDNLSYIHFSRTAIDNMITNVLLNTKGLKHKLKITKPADEELDDHYFNYFFKNNYVLEENGQRSNNIKQQSILQKYGYNREWKVKCFATDGYGVSVIIQKTKELINEPVIQINKKSDVDNNIKLSEMAGIDPGVGSFITIGSLNEKFDNHFSTYNFDFTSRTRKGDYKFKSVTSKSYYKDCKYETFRLNRKLQYHEIQNGFMAEYMFNKPSRKTTDLNDIKNYIRYRCENLSKLADYWIDPLNKQRTRRFEAYKVRMKYFDSLIAKLRKYKKIFIGDFKNRQRMKYGQKIGPICYFINFCIRNHLAIEKIDEFRTSVLCHKCNSRLSNFDCKTGIINDKPEFCKHKRCKVCKLNYNRDENAAINILRLGLQQMKGEIRQDEFSRSTPEEIDGEVDEEAVVPIILVDNDVKHDENEDNASVDDTKAKDTDEYDSDEYDSDESLIDLLL